MTDYFFAVVPLESALAFSDAFWQSIADTNGTRFASIRDPFNHVIRHMLKPLHIATLGKYKLYEYLGTIYTDNVYVRPLNIHDTLYMADDKVLYCGQTFIAHAIQQIDTTKDSVTNVRLLGTGYHHLKWTMIWCQGYRMLVSAH